MKWEWEKPKLILANPQKCLPNGEFAVDAIHEPSSSPHKIQTKATEVVCPSQIVTQWEKEITSNSVLKVQTATTLGQIRKLSYRDLVNADVVIVSHSLFFSNKPIKMFAKTF